MLILPPGVVIDGPAEHRPPCSICGQPMPAFTAEQWTEYERLSRTQPVSLRHEVCPGQIVQTPKTRRFEARVRIIEVIGDDPATLAFDELASFIAHTDAVDFPSSLRPLALALGEKWSDVEDHAHIADPNAMSASTVDRQGAE